MLFGVHQFWVLVIGALAPAVGYMLNHYAPWASERAKAIIHVLVAAAAGALYTALDTNVFGWNNATAQLVLTAVAAAFSSHALFWHRSGWSAKFGGGSNAAA